VRRGTVNKESGCCYHHSAKPVVVLINKKQMLVMDYTQTNFLHLKSSHPAEQMRCHSSLHSIHLHPIPAGGLNFCCCATPERGVHRKAFTARDSSRSGRPALSGRPSFHDEDHTDATVPRKTKCIVTRILGERDVLLLAPRVHNLQEHP
jgi:hypothetical protein